MSTMSKQEFSAGELKLLNTIINIQLLSYSRILDGSLIIEDEQLLLEFNSSLEEANNLAKWKVNEYKELLKEPLLLFIMQDNDIATLRHLLFHVEEKYMGDMVEDIMGLWKKFFLIEESRNPQIRLTTKTLKHYAKKKSKCGKKLSRLSTIQRGKK